MGARAPGRLFEMHPLVVLFGVAMTCEDLGNAPEDLAGGGFEEGGQDMRDGINL